MNLNSQESVRFALDGLKVTNRISNYSRTEDILSHSKIPELAIKPVYVFDYYGFNKTQESCIGKNKYCYSTHKGMKLKNGADIANATLLHMCLFEAENKNGVLEEKGLFFKLTEYIYKSCYQSRFFRNHLGEVTWDLEKCIYQFFKQDEDSYNGVRKAAFDCQKKAYQSSTNQLDSSIAKYDGNNQHFVRLSITPLLTVNGQMVRGEYTVQTISSAICDSYQVQKRPIVCDSRFKFDTIQKEYTVLNNTKIEEKNLGRGSRVSIFVHYFFLFAVIALVFLGLVWILRCYIEGSSKKDIKKQVDYLAMQQFTDRSTTFQLEQPQEPEEMEKEGDKSDYSLE